MGSLAARVRRATAAAAGAVDRLITAERLTLYPLTFLVMGAVILGATILIGDYPHIAGGEIVLPDFLAHWTGGRMLLDGDTAHLYDPATQLLVQSGEVGRGTLSWFVSPPFAAALYAPFASLGYGVAAIAWTAFSLACLVAAAVLVRPFAPRLFRDHPGGVFLVLASTQPVFELLGSGQDSGVSVLLWVAGLRLLLAGRDVSGGVVLALGLFKPQLFFVVPFVLAAQRRWRALGAWAATAAGLGLVSVGLVGIDGVADWLRVPFSDTFHAAVQVDQSWKMQSLPALSTTMGLWSWVATLVAFVAVLVLLRQLWRARAAGVEELQMWMLALMATMVASPHLVIYDLVVALVPLVWLVDRVNTRTVRLACLTLFVLTWTVPIRHLVGGPVDAAWSAIPLVILWYVMARTMLGDRHRVATAPSPPPALTARLVTVPPPRRAAAVNASSRTRVTASSGRPVTRASRRCPSERR